MELVGRDISLDKNRPAGPLARPLCAENPIGNPIASRLDAACARQREYSAEEESKACCYGLHPLAFRLSIADPGIPKRIGWTRSWLQTCWSVRLRLWIGLRYGRCGERATLHTMGRWLLLSALPRVDWNTVAGTLPYGHLSPSTFCGCRCYPSRGSYRRTIKKKQTMSKTMKIGEMSFGGRIIAFVFAQILSLRHGFPSIVFIYSESYSVWVFLT